MTDLHARHEAVQNPGAVVPAGIEAADQAREARRAAERRGDRDAVAAADHAEYVALGGEVEGVEPAGEAGGTWPTQYADAAARMQEVDEGAWLDLQASWGGHETPGFRENLALAGQLAQEVSAADPVVDDILQEATFRGQPLSHHPSIVGMLGRIARKLKGASAGPAANRGAKMQNGREAAGSVHDQIDAVRAERKLAHAQGDYRKVAELDEDERRLWAQTTEGRGEIVTGKPGHRMF